MGIGWLRCGFAVPDSIHARISRLRLLICAARHRVVETVSIVKFAPLGVGRRTVWLAMVQIERMARKIAVRAHEQSENAVEERQESNALSILGSTRVPVDRRFGYKFFSMVDARKDPPETVGARHPGLAE